MSKSTVLNLFRESLALWRKAWRREPEQRKTALSWQARHAIGFLRDFSADDAGCLAPVHEADHAAAYLAQRLAIRPRERRSWYRAIDELLAYGDDGEALALVIRDGHFYLTRFAECQAVRRPRVSDRVSDRADSAPVIGQPSGDKPAESLNTKKELATEDRGKRIELTNEEASKEKSNGHNPGVEAVLAHFHRADLEPFADLDDDARRKIIRNRLAEGCTVDECKTAIDRVAGSGLRMQDLPAVFRDAPTVRRNAARAPSRAELEAKQAEAKQEAERLHSERLAAKFAYDAANKSPPPPLDELIGSIGNYPKSKTN